MDDATRSTLAMRPFVSRFIRAKIPSRFSSRQISRPYRRSGGVSPFSIFLAIYSVKRPPQPREGLRNLVLQTRCDDPRRRELLDQAVKRLDQDVHPFFRDHAPDKQYPVRPPGLGNSSSISTSSSGSTPLYTTWTRLAKSGQASRMAFA